MPKQAAEFEFFHPDSYTVLHGFVYFRRDEMLLEIEEPGDTPWDIRGKANGAFFEGQHKARPGDPSSARAKWILLDDTYVGIWVEHGRDEYLFRFQVQASD